MVHPHDEKSSKEKVMVSSGKKGESMSELLSGVRLFISETAPLSRQYSVEVLRFESVQLTIDYATAVNVTLLPQKDVLVSHDESKKTFTCHIQPFRRTPIFTTKITDRYSSATLSFSYSCVMKPCIADDSNDGQLLSREKSLAQEFAKVSRLAFPMENVRTVIQFCVEQGVRFMDPQFAPFKESLMRESHDGDSDLKELVEGTQRKVQWRRPMEINPESTLFPVDRGILPKDLRQGVLSDNWLFATIAALSEKPHLLVSIFQNYSSSDVLNGDLQAVLLSPQGVYGVRLCVNGEWQEVIVDDLLPCYPEGGLLFTRTSCQQAFWPAILQKAVAKVFGSYGALTTFGRLDSKKRGFSGDPTEGLALLTGAPVLRLLVQSCGEPNHPSATELWSRMVEYTEKHFVMCATVCGDDQSLTLGVRSEVVNGPDLKGLIAGRSYTILSVRETRCGKRLVKLRNPWGRGGDWRGDWSEMSPLWTDELQAEVEPIGLVDDGTFWMSFEDVCSLFLSISVAMTSSALHTPEWRAPINYILERRFFNDSATEEDAAVIDAPHLRVRSSFFRFSVTSSNSFVFGISQPTSHIAKNGSKKPIHIGLVVFRVIAGGMLDLVSVTPLTGEGHVYTDPLQLSAGHYLLVPLTDGVSLARHGSLANSAVTAAVAKGEATETPLIVTKSDGTCDFSAATYAAYANIFGQLASKITSSQVYPNTDGEVTLCANDLQNYMYLLEGQNMSSSALLRLMNSFGTIPTSSDSSSQPDAQALLSASYMTRSQFLSCVKKLFDLAPEGRETRLRTELETFGFDNHLNPSFIHRCVLTVQQLTGTEHSFEGIMVPFSSSAYELAMQHWAERFTITKSQLQSGLRLATTSVRDFLVGYWVENPTTVEMAVSLVIKVTGGPVFSMQCADLDSKIEDDESPIEKEITTQLIVPAGGKRLFTLLKSDGKPYERKASIRVAAL